MFRATESSIKSSRAAMAVNNIAVSLIVRGWYKEAVEILTTNLTLQKSIKVIGGSSFSAQVFEAASVLHSELAMKGDHPCKTICLKVVEGTDLQAILNASSNIASPTWIPSPIRLSESFFLESHKMTILAAVSLYNLGLANLCLAKVCREGADGVFLKAAGKSFQNCEVLCNSLAGHSQTGIELTYFTSFLWMMTLGNLRIIYQKRSLPFMAMEMQQLVHRRSVQLERDGFTSLVMGQPESAAAAA